jgi:hypothetical protein
MESDHIYGLHLNIQGDAALLTHKVKDVRASAKKGQTVYQQPSLKPTMVGNMKGRNIIGTIKVAGRKKHPLYDVIDIDAATFSDYGFNAGGLLNNNLVEFDASIFEEDTINMNEGGAVMPMEKQMELFESGGNVDPVSGNDIPLGSTAKEVRDDQPAMLSEGEMVVPADVVRYFGVEYFMNLRDQAKMGYKKMEAMGQFGTEEGQTLPDDTLFNAGGPPFTIEDIEVIKDEDDDIIKAAEGALITEQNSSAEITDPKFKKLVPPAFSGEQAEEIIGTDNFNYLLGFMPEGFQNTLLNATGEDEKVVEEVKDFVNNNVQLDSSVQQGEGNEPGKSPTTTQMGMLSGGGRTTGSVQEMYSVPSPQNIQGLKDFNSNLYSASGRAFLGVADMFLGTVMTGAMAPGIKTVQMAASLMDPSIKQGFKDMYGIATQQAQAAGIAATAIEGFMSTLSKEEQQQLTMLAAADAAGLSIDNPNVDVVEVETTMGTQIGTQTKGTFGHTTVIGPTGMPEVVVGNIIGMLDKDKLDETQKNRGNLNKTTQNAIADMAKVGYTTMALGYNPGDIPDETTAPGGIAPTIDMARSMSPNFGLPDDDDIEAPNYSLNSYDYSTEGNPGLNDTGGGYSDPGGYGGGYDGQGGGPESVGGGDTGGGEESGNSDGADSGGSGAAADTGAEGPDGGVGGPGDFKRGGFVQNRKYKKKKKRRGLAGR